MGVLITFLLGLFILFGILVIKITDNSEKIEQLSIAIALGTMSCLIVFDLMQEVLEYFNNNYIMIIIFVFVGILLLKLLDIFIPEHDGEHSLSHHCSEENLIHIGIVSSIAIILHNIIEGMAVYNISLDDTKLALLVSIGVGLHNIPMGMIIYSTLEKEKKNKKILLISLVTLSTLIGGILMKFISSIISETLVGILICITVGMLLYIIIFELVPHLLHSKNKIISFIGIIIGIFIIFISSLFE